MIDLLNKYLNKLGVKQWEELNESEKETFKEWEAALKGRKLSDADVAQFLVNLENDIINELIDVKISDKRDIFLKVQLDLIRKIKAFLRTPELEKKLMETQLLNLMK